ncbi:beta-aspartyl-peptidase [Photobacterium rosenbergii]|uniref:beta-aspartyl-peptidase n=1 Tax=Photobacterium rosenbergii TaxID=294936 RepID=UPI001C994A6E|nr:beta-aspartyl-peptidase [Photobacterium rosenbergii]MBY5946112.1 beta-aspartyl-peptidase [Photobacterium rosenbergii]
MTHLTLIKNAKVYAPAPLGIKDVLVAGNKIVAIEDKMNVSGLGTAVTILDANGKIMIPGIIDQHVHLTGGGGEGGFSSRTPSITFSKLIKAGITSVVGVMGTDGSTRSPQDLFAKVMGLRAEGLSAWMHTGSYQVPTVTLTNTIRDDLVFLEPVLGVKIAIADHRGSFPSTDELLRITSDVRMGAMLAGKKGVLHMHMGGLPDPFKQINELVERGIPHSNFSPTHVARTIPLFEEAASFAKAGGVMDITSGGSCAFSDPGEAVFAALESGVPTERITISSDGNGSLPKFNEAGEMVTITAAAVDSNIHLLRTLIDRGLDIGQASAMMSENVAKSLGINKGEIALNADADFLLLDDNLDIDSVFSMGVAILLDKEQRVMGNFEE